MDLFTLPITQEHQKKAAKLADKYAYKGSIMKGARNYTSKLSELIISEFLGVKLKNKIDYDLYYKGQYVDIKSNYWGVPKPPPDDYIIKLPDTYKQKADWYIFTGLNAAYDKLYIFGAIKTKDFFLIARQYKKGDKFTFYGMNYEYKCNTFAVDLIRFKAFCTKAYGKKTTF